MKPSWSSLATPPSASAVALRAEAGCHCENGILSGRKEQTASSLRVAEAAARRCKIEDASASDQHAVCARAFQTAFDKLTGGKWSPANSKGGTAVHDHGASNWQSWISQDRDMVSPAIEATYLPGYLGYRYESFLYPLLEVIL